MKAKCLIVMSCLLSFLAFASPVLAVSLAIEQAPTTITDQPFTVDITLTGASAGQNYLRIDLYKDGTTNYFGETSVGSDWYSGSDGTSYVPITIPDSKTVVTATLQGRLGSPSQTDYLGPGNYKLRIRRYTSSGNSATTDEAPVDIQIVYAPPTPTPSPTPSPTPTDVPTPTRTPTPTKVPTPTSAKPPTATLTQKVVNALPSNKEGAMPSDYPTAVLGTSTSSLTFSPTPIPSPTEVLVKGTSETSGNILTLLFCGAGGILLSICGILLYLKKRNGDIHSL